MSLTVVALTAGCAVSQPVAVLAPAATVDVTYQPAVVVDLYPTGFYNRPLTTGMVLAGTQISMKANITATDTQALSPIEPLFTAVPVVAAVDGR